MRKFQILFFMLIANTLSAQIKVTIKGKITDSQYSNHAIEYSVFKKNNALDLTKLIDFKTGNFGEFNIIFSLDKPQPLRIVRSDLEGFYSIDFWGDGKISIDCQMDEQVTFSGDNQLANNLLSAIKIADNKNYKFLSEYYADGEKPTKDKIYLSKLSKLLQDLKNDYKINIEKKVPLELDNWIATEIKAFGLVCEARFYDTLKFGKPNIEMDKELIAFEQNLYVNTLKTSPESALLSDYFLKYFELCYSHNSDFNYRSTSNGHLYGKILSNIKVSPENANMNYHNNDDNEPHRSAIDIFNSRAIIHWIKENLADKPKFLEYILVKNCLNLGYSKEVRPEQILLLEELKQKFPNSNGIKQIKAHLKSIKK